MGIAVSVVRELRVRGHDSVHLKDEGLDRLADSMILEKGRAENRIILTHDLDFGDLLAAGGHSSPSVITFRLSNMRGPNVLEHLLAALNSNAEDLAAGACLTITDSRARCRRLPI